jgi:hypothetical protein
MRISGIVHDTLAENGTHLGHLRRELEQVRQQSPRERPFTVEFAGRCALQLLELALTPIPDVFAAGRS